MYNYIHFAKFAEMCKGKDKDVLSKIEKQKNKYTRKNLEEEIETDKKYYAINTGVGALLNKHIPKCRMSEFQENLILSHSCGVGKPIEIDIARGVMLHMIISLKKGYSGVKLETIEFLIKLFNENITPVIPEKGSLGASGDLIPQAHVAACFLGAGDVWYLGKRQKTSLVFKRCGIQALKLEEGEAIALLNGTSFMVSHMAFVAFHVYSLIEIIHIAAAMSVAALSGNVQSFELSPQGGSCHKARNISAYRIAEFLGNNGRDACHNILQDAYSLRCAPRVSGAFLETYFYYFWRVVLEELNNFSGNPEIFFDKRIIEQGRDNFHGQSLAQAADSLSVGLANIAGISERRIEKLLSGTSEGLPPFLVKNSGLNTGLMIAQYTAASLVAENRLLASPASIHSISVAAGQEDFVSMGALAARKLWEVCKNTEYVIAIELICAAQAMDFKKSDYLKNSKIRKIHKIIRNSVSYIEKDIMLSDLIKTMFNLIHHHGCIFLKEVERETGVSPGFFTRNMLSND